MASLMYPDLACKRKGHFTPLLLAPTQNPYVYHNNTRSSCSVSGTRFHAAKLNTDRA